MDIVLFILKYMVASVPILALVFCYCKPSNVFFKHFHFNFVVVDVVAVLFSLMYMIASAHIDPRFIKFSRIYPLLITILLHLIAILLIF